MEATIRIESLRVDRGRTQILRGIDLEIRPGAVTGILGPSGSGKTTLLRTIVGVQRVTDGAVKVFGRDAASRRMRGHIGYMTQSASVYEDLTVAENVHYFAALNGAGRHDAKHAIATVGLAECSGRVVHSLSGGQRSRVSLACAIVARPKLLVLDEPTVGQDPMLREELWHLFHEMAAAGAVVIVSSHVMDEANRCDELALMRSGSLLARGRPSEIKELAGTENLDEAFVRLVTLGGEG